MSDVAALALKGCVGGLFVVAFAVLSECLRPKTFAGLYDLPPPLIAKLKDLLIPKR